MNSKWEKLHIKDVALVKGGKRLPKGSNLQTSKNNHPYIRTKDIKENKLFIDEMEYVPEKIFPSIKKYTVEEGNLIISIVTYILNILVKIPFPIFSSVWSSFCFTYFSRR